MIAKSKVMLQTGAWTWAPPTIALLMVAVIVLTGINHSAFLILNRIGHAAGDTWWANLTIFGDGAIALALILPSIKRSPQRFWAALLGAIIATILVQVWKHYIATPRPLAVFPAGAFFHTGPEFRAASSPSGHAAAIFTLTGVWIMSLSGQAFLKTLLLLLAVMVSLSRIMVGVHWPLDILVGMLIGWLSAGIGVAIASRRAWQTASAAGYIAGVVLAVVAGALLVSNHIGYPSAVPLQRVIGVVCLFWGARELYALIVDRLQHRTSVMRHAPGKSEQ